MQTVVEQRDGQAGPVSEISVTDEPRCDANETTGQGLLALAHIKRSSTSFYSVHGSGQRRITAVPLRSIDQPIANLVILGG